MTSTTALQADQGLAKSKNCFACHSQDKSIVGPAFKDVSLKYAGDNQAAAYLAQKIQKGGDGVWGTIPMPPNTQVTDSQAKKLATWILGIK